MLAQVRHTATEERRGDALADRLVARFARMDRRLDRVEADLRVLKWLTVANGLAALVFLAAL